MEVKRDGGSLQKENAPRYIVSIGSYVSEGSALTRQQAASKAGYRAEVIDLRDDNATTTVAALLLIAEQVKALSVKLDEVTKAVKNIQKAEPKAEAKAEPPKPRTVGEVIREYRTRAGLTLEQVAVQCGVSNKSLSRYELGQHDTPPKVLFILRDVLKIPNDEIIKFL